MERRARPAQTSPAQGEAKHEGRGRWRDGGESQARGTGIFRVLLKSLIFILLTVGRHLMILTKQEIRSGLHICKCHWDRNMSENSGRKTSYGRQRARSRDGLSRRPARATGSKRHRSAPCAKEEERPSCLEGERRQRRSFKT